MARVTVYRRSLHARILHIEENLEHKADQNTIGNVLKIKQEPRTELENDDCESISNLSFDDHHENEELSSQQNSDSLQHKDIDTSISNQGTLQNDVDVSRTPVIYQNNKENEFRSKNSNQFMYKGLCISIAEFENELERTLANITKTNRDSDRKRKRSLVNTSIEEEQNDCGVQRPKRRRTRLDKLSDYQSQEAPFRKMQTATYNREDEKRAPLNLVVVDPEKRVKRRTINSSRPIINKRQGRGFKCTTCDLFFPTVKQLNYHENHYSKNGNCVTCNDCNISFGWKYQLVYHIRSAHSTAVDQKYCKSGFVCFYCNQVFPKKKGIQAHLKHYHNGESICTLITKDQNKDGNKTSYLTERLANSEGSDILFPQNLECTTERSQDDSSASLGEHGSEESEQWSETDNTFREHLTNRNSEQNGSTPSSEYHLSDTNRDKNTNKIRIASDFDGEPNVSDVIHQNKLLIHTNMELDEVELCATLPRDTNHGIISCLRKQPIGNDQAQSANEPNLNYVLKNVEGHQGGTSPVNLLSMNEEINDTAIEEQDQNIIVTGPEMTNNNEIDQRDDIIPGPDDQVPSNDHENQYHCDQIEEQSLGQNTELVIRSSNYSSQEDCISLKQHSCPIPVANHPVNQIINSRDPNQDESLEHKDDSAVRRNGELADGLLIDSNKETTIGLNQNDRYTRSEDHSISIPQCFNQHKTIDLNKKNDEKYVRHHTTFQNTVTCARFECHSTNLPLEQPASSHDSNREKIKHLDLYGVEKYTEDYSISQYTLANVLNDSKQKVVNDVEMEDSIQLRSGNQDEEPVNNLSSSHTRFEDHPISSPVGQAASSSGDSQRDKYVDLKKNGDGEYIEDHHTSQDMVASVLNDSNQEKANEISEAIGMGKNIQLYCGNLDDEPDDALANSLHRIEGCYREGVVEDLITSEGANLRSQSLPVQKEFALSEKMEPDNNVLESMRKISLEFQTEAKGDTDSEERRVQSSQEKIILVSKFHDVEELECNDSTVISTIKRLHKHEMGESAENSEVKQNATVSNVHADSQDGVDTCAYAREQGLLRDSVGQETRSAQNDNSRMQNATSFSESVLFKSNEHNESTKLDSSGMQNEVQGMIHNQHDENTGNTTVPLDGSSDGLHLSKNQLCSDHNQLEESNCMNSVNVQTSTQSNDTSSASHAKCKEISIHLMRIDEFLKSYSPSIVSHKKSEVETDNLRLVSPDYKNSASDVHSTEQSDHKGYSLDCLPKQNKVRFKEISIPLVRLEDIEGSCMADVQQKILQESSKSSGIKVGATYDCDTCSKTFASEDVFKKHVKWAHSQFVCNICGEQLTKKARLISHYLLRHTESGSNRCCVCGKLCSHLLNLKKHLSLHSTNRIGKQLIRQQCLNCNKKFRSSHDFKLHSRLCKRSTRIHACDLCGKKFIGASRLQEHRYMCNVANKNVTQSKESLSSPQHRETDSTVTNEVVQGGKISHPKSKGIAVTKESVIANVHSKTKDDSTKHMCGVCEKQFGKKCQLRDHFFVAHTIIRYYNCNICQKAFIWRSELLAHACPKKAVKPSGIEKKHEQVVSKNHAASENTDANGRNDATLKRKVKFNFTCKVNLLRKVHNGETKYTCALCDAGYTKLKSYKYHLLQHYKAAKIHWCENCGKEFRSNSNMLEHTCKINRARMSLQCNSVNTSQIERVQERARTRSNSVANSTEVNEVNDADSKQKVAFELTWKANLSIKSNREQQWYKCRLCNVQYKHLNSFKHHFLKHYKDEKNNWCENCGERFLSNRNMLMHRCGMNRSRTEDQSTRETTLANQKVHETAIHLVPESTGADEMDEVDEGASKQKVTFGSTWRANVLIETEEEQQIYKCGLCGIKYKSPSGFRHHFLQHYKDERNHWCENCGEGFLLTSNMLNHTCKVNRANCQCKICGQSFQEYQYLQQHLLHFSNDGNYMCEFCGTRFWSKYLLESHMRGAHDPKMIDKYKLRCRTCNQGFQTTPALENHTMHYHGRQTVEGSNVDNDLHVHDSQSFRCEVCNVQFKNCYSYDEHKAFYSNEKDHICSFCGIVFTGEYLLDSHTKAVHETVATQNTYVLHCDICKQGFMDISGLRAHMMHCHNVTIYDAQTLHDSKVDSVHNVKQTLELKHSTNASIESHECNICEMDFASASFLEMHKDVYSNDGDFECTKCERRCRTNAHLNKHYLTRHTCSSDNFKYKCTICGELSITQISWWAHMKHFHDNQSGKIMKPISEDNRTFRPHQESVSLDTIGNSEIDSRAAISNSTDDGASGILCITCKQTFQRRVDFNNHLLEYSNDGNYPCSVCGRRCSSSFRLSQHKKKHNKSFPTTYKLRCSICSERFSRVKSLNAHEAHLHGTQMTTRTNFALTSITSCGNAELESDSDNVSHNAQLLAEKAIKKEIETELNDDDLTSSTPNNLKLTEKTVPSSSIVDNSVLKSPLFETSGKQSQKKLNKIKSTSSTEQMTRRMNVPCGPTVNCHFECGVCGVKFNSKSNLSKHLTKYTDEGNHICEICNRRFAWITLLDSHVRKHAQTGRNSWMKFSCEICSERFKSSVLLKSHKMHFHPEHTGVRNTNESIKNQLEPTLTNICEPEPYNVENEDCASASHSTADSGALNIATNKQTTDLHQICVGEAYHIKNDGDEPMDPLAIDSECKEEPISESNDSNEVVDSHHETINALPSFSSRNASDNGTVPNLREPFSSSEWLVETMTGQNKMTKCTCFICKKTFSNAFQFGEHFAASHGDYRQTLLQSKGNGRTDRNQWTEFPSDSSTKSNYGNTENARVISDFHCTVCNEAFASSQLFTKHQVTCSVESSFVCDMCNVSFDNLRRLNFHKKLVHNLGSSSGSVELYSCSYCSSCFTVERNLHAHVNDVHSKSCESQKTSLAAGNTNHEEIMHLDEYTGEKTLMKKESSDDHLGSTQFENQSSTDTSKVRSVLFPVTNDSMKSVGTVTDERSSYTKECKQVGKLKVKSFAKIIENLTEATICNTLGPPPEEDSTLKSTGLRGNNEVKYMRYTPANAHYVAENGKVNATRQFTGSMNEFVNSQMMAYRIAEGREVSVTKGSREFVTESANPHQITGCVAKRREMDTVNRAKNPVIETVTQSKNKQFSGQTGKMNAMNTFRESDNNIFIPKISGVAQYVVNQSKVNLMKKFGESSTHRNTAMLPIDDDEENSGQKLLNRSHATEKPKYAEEHIYRLVIPNENKSLNQTDYEVEYVETSSFSHQIPQNRVSVNNFWENVQFEAHTDQAESIDSRKTSTNVDTYPIPATARLKEAPASIWRGKLIPRRKFIDGNPQLQPKAPSEIQLVQEKSSRKHTHVKLCGKSMTIPKTHACMFCDLHFSSKTELAQHWKAHKSLRCNICGLMLTSEAALLGHMSVHASLKCRICGKVCISEEVLNQHMELHNCSKETLPPTVNVQAPCKPHTASQCMRCALCQMEFDSVSEVTKHFKAVHCSYSCSICMATFISKNTIMNHMRSHFRGPYDKSLFCEKCKVAFIDELDLAVHNLLCN